MLEDPHSLAFPPAQLRDLQGSLLRATAALHHSRAMHCVDGLLTADPAPSGRRSSPLVRPGSRSMPPGISQPAVTPLTSSAMRAMRLKGSLSGSSDDADIADGTGVAADESFVRTMERRLKQRARVSALPMDNGLRTCSPAKGTSASAQPAAVRSPLSSPEADSPASAREPEDHSSGQQLVLGSGAGGQRVQLGPAEKEMLLRGITREVDRLLGRSRHRHSSPPLDITAPTKDLLDPRQSASPDQTATSERERERVAAAAPPTTAASSGGIGRGRLTRRVSHSAEVGAAQVHCNPLYTKQEDATGGGTRAVRAGGKKAGVPGSTECIDAIAEQIAAKLLTKLQARYGQA